MRLQQFIINESKEFGSDVIKQIHQDCKKYFKDIRYGQKIFRGVRKTYPNGYSLETFKSRLYSVDTPAFVHEFLNKAFKKKFGIGAREDCLFCTVCLYQAEDFGKTYYVFFVGDNYKIIYSPTIIDLTTHLQDSGLIYYSKGKYYETENINEKDAILIMTDIVNKHYKITSDVNQSMGSAGELMVKTDKYYMVEVSLVQKHFDEIFGDTRR